MREILIAFVLVISIFIIYESISDRLPKGNKIDVETKINKKRIIFKEAFEGYNIIEIDSVEYLTSNYGGIYPLLKK